MIDIDIEINWFDVQKFCGLIRLDALRRLIENVFRKIDGWKNTQL